MDVEATSVVRPTEEVLVLRRSGRCGDHAVQAVHAVELLLYAVGHVQRWSSSSGRRRSSSSRSRSSSSSSSGRRRSGRRRNRRVR